jgi:hypothetical protein
MPKQTKQVEPKKFCVLAITKEEVEPYWENPTDEDMERIASWIFELLFCEHPDYIERACGIYAKNG